MDVTTPTTKAHRFFRLTATGALLACWVLWVLSLYYSFFLLFAFDSEVSIRGAALLGAIHASWVGAIPIVLLFAGHLMANGWTSPNWKRRWLAVGLALVLWVLVFGFWILAGATD